MNFWLMQRRRLRVATTAGLGAACFLIIFQAIQKLSAASPKEQKLSLLALAIAFVVIVGFLEPLTNRLRLALGIHPHQFEASRVKRYLSLLAAVIVIFAASLHGILHEQISHDPMGYAFDIINMLLLPGSITFCWMVGVRWHPARAKWLGALGGLIIGFIIRITVIPILCGINPEMIICQTFLIQNHHEMFGVLALQLGALNALQWGVLGFVGGLAVDRGYGLGILLFYLCIANVTMGMMAASGVEGTDYKLATWLTAISIFDFFKMFGWGIGLWVDPHSRELLNPGGDLDDKLERS